MQKNNEHRQHRQQMRDRKHRWIASNILRREKEESVAVGITILDIEALVSAAVNIEMLGCRDASA